MAKKTVGDAKITLSLDDKELDRSLRAIEKKMKNVGKVMSAVGDDMIKVGGLITGAFAAVTKVFVDNGDALDKMSLKTGLAVEDLSNLELAAKLAGAEMEPLTKVLSRLAVQLQQGQIGNKATLDNFERLGIAFDDIKEKSPLEVLKAIAKATQDLDVTQKTGLLTTLLGEEDLQRILPLLDDFEGKVSKVEGMGIGITGAEATAAAELQDAITILIAELTKIASVVGKILTPALLELSGDIKTNLEDFRAWVDANPNFINVIAKTGAALVVMGAAVKTVGALLVFVASPIRTIISIVQPLIPAIQLLGGAFLTMTAAIKANYLAGVAWAAAYENVRYTLVKTAIAGKGMYAGLGSAIADFAKASGTSVTSALKDLTKLSLYQKVLLGLKSVIQGVKNGFAGLPGSLSKVVGSLTTAAAAGSKTAKILLFLGSSAKWIVALGSSIAGLITITAALGYAIGRALDKQFAWARSIGDSMVEVIKYNGVLRKTAEYLGLLNEQVKDIGAGATVEDEESLRKYLELRKEEVKQGNLSEENYRKQEKAINALRKAREEWINSGAKAGGESFTEYQDRMRPQIPTAPDLSLSIGGSLSTDPKVRAMQEEEIKKSLEEQARLQEQAAKIREDGARKALALEYEGEELQQKLLEYDLRQLNAKYVASDVALAGLNQEYAEKQKILDQEYEANKINNDGKNSTLIKLDQEYWKNKEILKTNYEQALAKQQGYQDVLNAAREEYDLSVALLDTAKQRAEEQRKAAEEEERIKEATANALNLSRQIKDVVTETGKEGLALDLARLKLARERAIEDAKAGESEEQINFLYDAREKLLRQKADAASTSKVEATGTFSTQALDQIFRTTRTDDEINKNTKITAEATTKIADSPLLNGMYFN